MNHLYFSDYDPKTNPEFSTRWANHWKDNTNRIQKLEELMTYRTIRGEFINSQKQFERHLHNLMNHRSHQQEF